MARDILGGNGILLDFHVMRHMCDMEALLTYEGTAEIQTLLVGRDITGQAPSPDPIRFRRSHFRRSYRPGQRAQRLQGDE